MKARLNENPLAVLTASGPGPSASGSAAAAVNS